MDNRVIVITVLDDKRNDFDAAEACIAAHGGFDIGPATILDGPIEFKIAERAAAGVRQALKAIGYDLLESP